MNVYVSTNIKTVVIWICNISICDETLEISAINLRENSCLTAVSLNNDPRPAGSVDVDPIRSMFYL